MTTDDAPETTAALTDDPRPDGLRSAPSLVLINTGNGKGKSSAAFGVMLRAVAAGWNVAVCQFIKSGDWKVGEEKVGRELGVEWHSFGDGFTWDSDDLDHDIALAQRGLDHRQGHHRGRAAPVGRARRGDVPVHLGLDRRGRRRGPIVGRPSNVNVIITGRDAPATLLEIADTVTEMTEIKHAYQQGIRAKRGIDY